MSEKLQDSENLPEYIRRRIGDIFNDAAAEFGDRLAAQYGEDMPAGSLVFELMSAQINLEFAWDKICAAHQQPSAALGAQEAG